MKSLPNETTIQAWVLLHRVHRKLLEQARLSLKNNDLPPLDWYDVLLELHREGSVGLRQYEIGERILLNKHNLSRLIDRLEKQHLVHRDACEEDGRGNRIKITAEGEKVLRRVWPVYGQSIQKEFGEKLGQSECLELSRLLEKVLEHDKGA
tara:strand:+ start:1594 stop:2046 length:453 start_codon:yes stop_codon:yes gene_type:complete